MTRPSVLKQRGNYLLWAVCLAAFAACLALPSTALAQGATIASGNLGSSGVSWTITDTGRIDSRGSAYRLSIGGKGVMPNYPSNDERPWHKWSKNILEVSIGDGVTRVGNYAFSDLDILFEISMGNTVQTVGNNAFCTKQQAVCSLQLSSALTSIGTKAFARTLPEQNTITLPSKLKTIGDKAFYEFNGGGLETVVFPKSIKSIGARIIRDPGGVNLKYKGTKKQFYKVKISTKSNNAFLKEKFACSNGKTYPLVNFKTAKVSVKSLTYNGKKRKPKVTVKNALGKKMKKGKDYKVKYYGKRKRIGVYDVVVKPLSSGFFAVGSKQELTFTIRPRVPKMKVYVEHPKYPPGAKDYITMSWKDKYYKKVEGYEIQWSTKKSFKPHKNVDAWNLDIVYNFPKVKRGQTVYARMRAYKNTDNDILYSKWTKIKHVKWK